MEDSPKSVDKILQTANDIVIKPEDFPEHYVADRTMFWRLADIVDAYEHTKNKRSSNALDMLECMKHYGVKLGIITLQGDEK